MEPDENYPFFFEALKHFVSKKKRDGMQKKLHYDAGISQSLLSMLLSGKKPGSVRSHMKIAKALGYSYDDFIALGRSLIETGKPLPPSPDQDQIKDQSPQPTNIIAFPMIKSSSYPPRLLKMMIDLKVIYDSGDQHIVAAIETNLLSFLDKVELSKKVSEIENQLQSERNAKGLLAEENEALKKRMHDKK